VYKDIIFLSEVKKISMVTKIQHSSISITPALSTMRAGVWHIYTLKLA